MRKRWFFGFLLLLTACQQALGTPVPTAVVPPTPMVAATPVQLPPATSTAHEEVVEETSEAETDLAVLAGCLRAEDVEVDLRAATQRLVDAGQAPNWEAATTLQVTYVTKTQFGCVYQIRLWGVRYDKFSDYKNIEKVSLQDVISLNAATTSIYPDSNLAIFRWTDDASRAIADPYDPNINYDVPRGGFLLTIPNS